ncbi:hypothetical protein, partial [Frankia gtarii]
LARPIPAQSATWTGADLDDFGYPKPPPDDDPLTLNDPFTPHDLITPHDPRDLSDLGVPTGAQVSPFADTVPMDVTSLRRPAEGQPPETS